MVERKPVRAWWGRQSIYTMIMLSFGFLFALMMSLSAIAFTLSVRHTLNQSVQDNNKKLVDQAVVNMDELTDLVTALSFYVSGDQGLKQLLKQIPDNPAEQVILKNSIRSYLTQLWMNRPEIVGITIYHDKVSEINEGIIGLSSTSFLRNHGWLDELGSMKGIILNSSRPIARGSVEYNVFSLVKISDDDNDLLGLLSFEISAKNLYLQCIEPAKASPNSLIFAIDRDGIISSFRDSSSVGLPTSSLVQDMDISFAGITKYDGRRYIQVLSKESRLGWRIIEMIPLKEIINYRPLIIQYIAFTLVAIFISFALTYILARRLTKPIIDLSQIMASETPLDGTFPADLLNSQNEVGSLYRSYAMMIENTNDLIGKLQESNETQRRLETDILRAQINPHFMYNCLDFINWKAQDKQVPEISRMLTHLSRFVRISLAENNLTCPLKDEIEHVTTYLGIFQVRYQDSFTYEIDAPANITQTLVPQFILQPIVENSIIHGFGKNLMGGRIEIAIVKRGQWLCFDISDNGSGMDKDAFNELFSKSSTSSRNGLKNVSDRIRNIASDKGFTGFQYVDSPQGLHIHFALDTKKGFPMDELVKVLIIDDEDFVIEGLQRHIAWENLGMQVVGTASDGKDGVVQTLRLKPDCIITDISMPNMDGISMIEHLYKMGLRPYTLIYTGYNDFEYAQRALIYGVSDYILKPALPEEFEQSLGIICKKIRGEWKNIEELQRLRQNFEESKQLLFKPFLEELFTGRIITHEQFARKDMFFGSNLVDREYVVIAIHLDCNQEQFSNLDIEQQFYVMYRIIHFVQSLFPGLTYSTGFQANTAFFLCANDIQSIQLQEMVGLCTRILNYCNSIDDLNLLVRIGISDIVVTYEEIHVAYLQAKQCIRESEDNEVLQYAHCCDDADSPIISWGFDKDQLIDAMLLGNVELATQLTDKFFLYLSKLPPPRDVYLTPMIAELVSSIMVFLVQHGIESDLDAFELVSQRFSTIQEAHKRVTEFVNSSIAAIQKRELGKNYQIINRIVSYTKEHLEEGITLSRIADIMQFTPNYLSTLFTKSMGISYSQYLAKIRIQRAKELLDSGKYKVYEVGYMIGFKNPEYFTKVFKEYVGTTPSSYIKPQ